MSDLDDVRRMRVASLHLRGLTPLEIRSALPKEWDVDTDTICSDIQFLERVWTTDIQVGARHKARILAEIREARRVSWSQADMALVLQGLKQENGH